MNNLSNTQILGSILVGFILLWGVIRLTRTLHRAWKIREVKHDLKCLGINSKWDWWSNTLQVYSVSPTGKDALMELMAECERSGVDVIKF